MPKGIKKEKTYTGKALKAYEKVKKLEIDLKAAKEKLKILYQEQVKEEKAAQKKAQKREAIAVRKATEEKNRELIKAFESSGKSQDEILEFLKPKQSNM